MIRKLAVALALTLPLAAQVTETIEVAVTSVDVVVTDAKGNRVHGLTKADFEVIEDGKVREISNFSEYALTAPPPALSNAAATVSPAAAAVASQPVLTPPRRLLMIFDGNTLTSKHRRNGAAAALKFIDAHMRPADKVLVAVITQQFTPRTDWTSDKNELRKVIQAIGSEVTVIGADVERKRAEGEMTYLIDIAASTVGTDPRRVAPPKFEELITIARMYAEHALQETRSTAALLGTVVAQLSTYPEKKALVFIGEGLDARPGWELFERVESIRSGKVPSIGLQVLTGQTTGENLGPPPSLVAEAARYSATPFLQRLAEDAYRKGVPIYAINPGTNEEADTAGTDLPEPGQQFARFVSKRDGYMMVGDGSGGAAYVGMRAEMALDQVAADMGSYYSLGFRASGPPKRASIRVKPRNAGHRVRVALAGTPISPTDAVTDAVTAHHVLEPSTNDLEIELEALEPIAAGEKQKVTLHVIIPIRNLSLVRQGDELTGGFDVYLSISDGKGYFSPVNKQSHAIKWPAAPAGEDDERTMTYSIDVTMEPGSSQISVGVVDQRSKKTGYERISV